MGKPKSKPKKVQLGPRPFKARALGHLKASVAKCIDDAREELRHALLELETPGNMAEALEEIQEAARAVTEAIALASAAYDLDQGEVGP